MTDIMKNRSKINLKCYFIFKHGYITNKKIFKCKGKCHDCQTSVKGEAKIVKAESNINLELTTYGTSNIEHEKKYR